MASADDSVTRLHVSPLAPDLFKLLFPPSKLPSYANLSYHQLQTFPERSYAFLDVPSTTAEELRKQLNGVIIRGQKISISKARADIWATHSSEGEQDTEQDQYITRRERGAVPGIELPNGRKVQRGWTKPAKEKSTGKRRVARSIYTAEPECLFKMAPRNGPSGPSRARSKVIHEFEKTTKFPSFLKSAPASGKPVYEYKEGVGWVDENEDVVDKAAPRALRVPVKNAGRWEGSSRVEKFRQRSEKRVSEDSINLDLDPETSEVSSSASDSDPSSAESDSSSNASSSTDSDSDSSESESSEAESSDESLAHEPEIHPLEAVFKQQLKQPETEAPFSFFGQEQEAEVEREAEDTMSIEDYGVVSHEEVILKDNSADRNVPVVPFNPDPDALMNSVIRSLNLKLPENAKPFTDEFYETRGETNRTWKKRRREAKKDQRKRENKRREKRML